MNQTLGTQFHIAAYLVEGNFLPETLCEMLRKIVSFVGMSTGGMRPKIWTYPLIPWYRRFWLRLTRRVIVDGPGGMGQTICQPLIESLSAADNWPELGHVLFLLVSCRPFDRDNLAEYIRRMTGNVKSFGGFQLGG